MLNRDTALINSSTADLDAALASRLAKLEAHIARLQGVVVGLSGGVDSTLLATLAQRVLGSDRVIAATAVSPSLGVEDREFCRSFSQLHKLQYVEVSTEEFENEEYLRNDSMRCYYCKSALMDKLAPLAQSRDMVVVLGVNVDDLSDIRPGQRAAAEAGAVFPFVEAGISKDDIRSLAKWLALETWDRPQAACLASRIPFGVPVTLSSVSEVDRAERALRRLGFRQLRVRHHGEVARLEITLDEMDRVLAMRDEVVDAVREAGFAFVALDLEGFRSGSMHRMTKTRQHQGGK